MSRWRIGVVLALVVLPVLFLAAVGSYQLWQRGLSLAVWWPMMACVALGYLLGAYWQRRRRLLHPVDMTPPAHATERDRRAWALIERTNVASTRAFEKAAYASVADVVYARMGLASRLFVRQPDPEARAFLVLS